MSPSKGNLRTEEQVPVTRIAPPPEQQHLVRWYWVPQWDFADGESFESMTLPYPACQLVVEPDGVHAYGPVTRAWRRTLTGQGWAVGALLRPAAAYALLGPPGRLADEHEPVDAPVLHTEVAQIMSDGEDGPARATERLGGWLVDQVGAAVAADPDADLARRLVELADSDPEILRVTDLAQRLAVSERTLQRLATSHVGLSPSAIIRRRRLQEAAQRVRLDPDIPLAEVAAELGYADHAHLSREFRRTLGFTPQELRRQG